MRPTFRVGVPMKFVLYLLPLFLIVLGLGVWFGGLGSNPPRYNLHSSVQVLSDAPTARWLRLPDNVAASDLTGEYIATGDNMRARVLQNLSEFRTTYKQLAPFMKVSAAPGNEAGQQLAQRIGSSLAHYGLGRAVKADSRSLPDRQRASLVLLGARDDAEIIQHLLAALSPYLSGDVLVQFDDTRRIDQLELYLLGKPSFTAEGVAVFSNTGAMDGDSSY